MTATSTATDRTVIAQDAPIGQLMWPVLDARYAPNFTLESVKVHTTRTRDTTSSYVEWVYENGSIRLFDLGEEVACRW